MITKLNYLLLIYFVCLIIFAHNTCICGLCGAWAVFLRSAGAARARCIIARLLEPALAAALNQPKRVRQTGFLRAALTAAVGDALRLIIQYETTAHVSEKHKNGYTLP